MVFRITAFVFVALSIFFLISWRRDSKLWKKYVCSFFALLSSLTFLFSLYSPHNTEFVYPTLDEAFHASCKGILVGSIDGEDSSLAVYMGDDNYRILYLWHEDKGYSLMDRGAWDISKYGMDGTMMASIVEIRESCDQYLVVEGISNGLEIEIPEEQVSDIQIFKELPVISVNATKFIAIGLLNTDDSLEQITVKSESGITAINLTETENKG